MLSALIGIIIGAIITWTMTFYLKNRDVKISARNHAFLLSLTLAEQLSSLANVNIHLNIIYNRRVHQKFLYVPSFFTIKNDSIAKILECQKFINFSGSGTTIQKLTIVQRIYDLLILYVNYYNSLLTPERLTLLEEKKQTPEDGEYINNSLEIQSALDGIVYKFNEVTKHITNTKKDFDHICEQVFNENDGFCEKMKEYFDGTIKKLFKGYNYKPPSIDDKIIKADDL